MPNGMEKNFDSNEGQYIRPEDFLNFDLLSKLAQNEITDPQKQLTVQACVNQSPLYSSALEGLKVFLEKEGKGALEELLDNDLRDQFNDLMMELFQ